MIAVLLALTLSSQGTTLQNDNGTITGVLKTSAGQPAVSGLLWPGCRRVRRKSNFPGLGHGSWQNKDDNPNWPRGEG